MVRVSKRRRRRRVKRGPGIRGLIVVGVSLGVILLVAVAGVFAAGPLGDALRLAQQAPVPDAPQTVVVPPVSAAVAQPSGTAGALPGVAGEVDVAWATALAQQLNISLPAIQAYAGVALAKQREAPECHIGWNTLAAVGSVESGNGTHGGSTVAADGQVNPPIYGIALDGNGVTNIPDTDGGAIDGDPVHDRAVGPMQLIPEAWRNWGTDANGDGVADPQNLDDSVLATANYLCHAGGDLGTDVGWRRAIASYNNATSYALKVSTAANRFAAAASPLS